MKVLSVEPSSLLSSILKKKEKKKKKNPACFTNCDVACEQALLFGQAKRFSIFNFQFNSFSIFYCFYAYRYFFFCFFHLSILNLKTIVGLLKRSLLMPFIVFTLSFTCRPKPPIQKIHVYAVYKCGGKAEITCLLFGRHGVMIMAVAKTLRMQCNDQG